MRPSVQRLAALCLVAFLRTELAAADLTSPSPSPSPLDRLDANRILAAHRFEGQPKEIVAVLGEYVDPPHEQWFRVAFHPNGRLLAVSKPKGGVQIWDLTGESPKEIAALTGPHAYDLRYSPDGKLLASASSPVMLWDVSGAKPTERAVLSGH